jgi:hypothetical protein
VLLEEGTLDEGGHDAFNQDVDAVGLAIEGFKEPWHELTDLGPDYLHPAMTKEIRSYYLLSMGLQGFGMFGLLVVDTVT